MAEERTAGSNYNAPGEEGVRTDSDGQVGWGDEIIMEEEAPG